MSGGLRSEPLAVLNQNDWRFSLEYAVYLKHLVLHEVAHAANNWPQSMETECDLWALAKLNQEQR